MVPSLTLSQQRHDLLSCLQKETISTVLLKLSSFYFSLRADNMPENARQDGGVLCSRVGAERHWQGNDTEMLHM